jgi:hypothetical protein
MRDFKTILLAVFVAGVIAIAGLLFSINHKLNEQKNDSATTEAPAPAVDAKPADPNAAPAPPVDGVPPVSALEAADRAMKEARHEKPSPSPVKKDQSAASRPDRFADLAPRSAPPDATPAPAKDPNGISYDRTGSAPPITAALPPPPMPEPPASLKTPKDSFVPASTPSGPPKTVTIPEGTSFRVRLIDRIDANRMHAGDTFRASLDENVIVDGMTVANRGSSVSGRLVEDKQAGRVSGGASLTLALDHLTTVAGDQSITTDSVKKDAGAQTGKDAAKIGGLGALGAIIGAVAGGGKGAAIGAGAGAGAGAIDVLTSKGKDLKLGPETPLIFRLGAPVTFTVDPSRVQAASTRSTTPADNDPDRPILRRRTDP